MTDLKLGVVDVGGGLRGVDAAGVFDSCLDAGVRFDLCIGVSAGSANLASYVAGQRGRNYWFYTSYPFRKEYMSLRNFLTKRSYLDLDYVYGTLSVSGGENPFDYRRFWASPAEYVVVAANAETGEVKYFTKRDMRAEDYSVLKASSAIPFVCHPYEVDGVPYYDGALGDPVPVDKAFALGCDRVVLVLTRPRDYLRTPERDEKLAARIRRQYPLAAEKLCRRAQNYNEAVARAKTYEAEGRVRIVAPDDTCGVSTLTKDKSALRRLYVKGYQDAEAIREFIG